MPGYYPTKGVAKKKGVQDVFGGQNSSIPFLCTSFLTVERNTLEEIIMITTENNDNDDRDTKNNNRNNNYATLRTVRSFS